MDFLNDLVDGLDRNIDQLVAQYEAQISLLCMIPGVRRNVAITIISEIGADMEQFGSSKRLCSWAGLTPGNTQSAGKKKSVHIMRAGVHLKPALVEATHAAVRCGKPDYYRIKFEQIARRRGKRRAFIAIARMILTAVYHMLLTGELFNPCELFKTDIPEELRDRQRQRAIRKAADFLVAQGVVHPEHLDLPDSA